MPVTDVGRLTRTLGFIFSDNVYVCTCAAYAHGHICGALLFAYRLLLDDNEGKQRLSPSRLHKSKRQSSQKESESTINSRVAVLLCYLELTRPENTPKTKTAVQTFDSKIYDTTQRTPSAVSPQHAFSCRCKGARNAQV